MSGARDRILAIANERERIIERQALVMNLATTVLSETSTEKAVQLLVDATYRVVNCDRVSLFLLEENCLRCHAAPAGGQLGWRLPLGKGIAGRVGASGETLNIADAYKCPDLFDASNDLKTGYRTCSILCMALKDREGGVIGVLQAINKHGSPVPERSGEEDAYMPFDSVDERMLELLLALTAQQLRVCELVASKDEANDRADKVMSLLEAISRKRDIDGSVDCLAQAVVSVASCQQVFIFLQEGEDLVCRAAKPLVGSLGVRIGMGASKSIIGQCASTGEDIIVNCEDGPEELLYVQQLLNRLTQDRLGQRKLSLSVSEVAKSAMCMPLKDDQTDQIMGVVLAVNKMVSLTDLLNDESTQGPQAQPRRRSADGATIDRKALEAHALGAILDQGSGQRRLSDMLQDSRSGIENSGRFESRFEMSDVDQLRRLLRLSAHMVTTAALYTREHRTTKKLNALLMLLSGCSEAFEKSDLQRVVLLISKYSTEMFECDRCTFFMVDNFSHKLVGHFFTEGPTADSKGELQEFRVPIGGIAGRVVQTGSMLNIKDAYADPGFSKEQDLKTGYCTRTILGAPLTTTNGKVIATIQCINKIRNEYFSKEDETMMLTVSVLLSDLCQRLLLQSSYKTFVQSSDTIESDVKDMFREYYTEGAASVIPYEGEAFGKMQRKRTSLSLTDEIDHADIVAALRRWTFDHCELGEDLSATMPYITSCFNYFGVLTKFQADMNSFENFIRSAKARYHYETPFHNWNHALTTLHCTFLLLDSKAFSGILEKQDIMGLLLAALGHDMEHPGFTNAFQIASQSQLAIRYNDHSVLENHHAAVTCQLLKGEPGIAQHIDAKTRSRIRQVLVNSILGTDMAKHHETIAWLESNHVDLTSTRNEKTSLEADDALKLCVALLHSADVGHPTAPWYVHKRVSLLVATEFLAQYEEETRLGLPTLPFMGKDPAKLQELAPIQVGFVQFVVAPLWSSLNFKGGEDHIQFAVSNLENNRRTWQQIADGQDVDDWQPFMEPPDSSEND